MTPSIHIQKQLLVIFNISFRDSLSLQLLDNFLKEVHGDQFNNKLDLLMLRRAQETNQSHAKSKASFGASRASRMDYFLNSMD